MHHAPLIRLHTQVFLWIEEMVTVSKQVEVTGRLCSVQRASGTVYANIPLIYQPPVGWLKNFCPNFIVARVSFCSTALVTISG